MEENMIDPLTVRYRKKVRTTIVILVSSIAIFAMVLISYLGTLVGNYTITVVNAKQYLQMDVTADFENPTTRLRATGIKDAAALSVEDLPSDDELDPLIGGAHNGNVYGSDYMAYTMYLRNSGYDIIDYQFTVKIEGVESSISDNATLDDVLRVRIYTNDVEWNEEGEQVVTHYSTTYAKKTRNPIQKGDAYMEERECIGRVNKDYTCSSRGYATPFMSEYIASLDGQRLMPRQIRRYSIVIWVEGDDPEAIGALRGSASIKLGMGFELTNVIEL